MAAKQELFNLLAKEKNYDIIKKLYNEGFFDETIVINKEFYNDKILPSIVKKLTPKESINWYGKIIPHKTDLSHVPNDTILHTGLGPIKCIDYKTSNQNDNVEKIAYNFLKDESYNEWTWFNDVHTNDFKIYQIKYFIIPSHRLICLSSSSGILLPS
jgi:hypothetical protein